MKYLIFLLTLYSAAAFGDCKWTVQGTDDNFKKDEIFSQKPHMQRRACAENGAPLCVGYVYCVSGNQQPPKVGPVACKAKKNGEGKWICPDGQTCYDDPDVAIGALTKNPELPVAPAQPAGVVPGTGDGIREGVGGR